MKMKTMDGNSAAAYISYAFSELAIVYPITPSSPMAELADEWQATDKTNLFGQVPKVVQMQSESGVAGALHGALTCGVLATTYTCSQGLLLMQPNMFKIAGELLPTVIHVSARALATHALSIFGDHQDVMACRQTGFAFLASSSVQETLDMALIAHLATLKTSVPFLHFFDGFRTSHEYAKIEVPEYEELQTLIKTEEIENFRARALDPDKPVQRGTAQNPDIYFQNREAGNRYYTALPKAVQDTMDEVSALTGRKYRLFDYYGASDAETVLVAMGSALGTIEETLESLNAKGHKAGVIKVRLYRPFHGEAFCAVLPKTCKTIVALERTKESGAIGEPLYLDICAALHQNGRTGIRVLGGRYGLGQKEFTPAEVYAVLKNAEKDEPKSPFTVGIQDDITFTSLPQEEFFLETDATACKFYGLGSDGTVGANKNAVKIIGDNTDLFVQAYFQYDSRKSGGVTVSHLRFGKTPIRSAYLVRRADFIACHDPSYITRYDMLSSLKDGGTFLFNCPWTELDELEKRIPAEVKRKLAQKKAAFFVIDGTKLAKEAGLRGRTGTLMQAAFFLLNETLLPYQRAEELLKAEIQAKFSRKGEEVVRRNFVAIEGVKTALKRVNYPESWLSATDGAPLPHTPKNDYYERFIGPVLSLKGDELPVSAFQSNGSVPTGTKRLETHGVAHLLPLWIPENCIQCCQCSFSCPHATIRPYLVDENEQTPEAFITRPAVGINGKRFRMQVALHECMGCGICANVCPAKEKALVMRPSSNYPECESENWSYAQTLTQTTMLKRNTVKGSQFYKPLFEFSYACAGCGETPYIKVLTQLFGEKMLIANATGCSSIYGGSAPTCPYTVNEQGKGPAWANSLFEDNAEFGYGMRLAWEVRGREDKSVWLIGGDGWAYDIGYGGLDHVLASGANINALVLDSEVYSNTGGQASKATPLGATARFAVKGKRSKKKDLGLMAITYGSVYVAQVSMGANRQQLLTALTEAEAYDGPSLIIAYSPCISHGVNMGKCMDEEKRAVESGHWILYRFNPALKKEGKNPFTLDSKPPTISLEEFTAGETRFAALKNTRPEEAEALWQEAQERVDERFAHYQKLVELFAPKE